MLVLTRKSGEAIVIGDNVRITVSNISGSRVKICIDAPKECAIRRGEIAVDTQPAMAAERSVQECLGRLPAGAVAR